MPIKFTCSGCGQVLRVGDESAGKRARCPKCRQVVEIPVSEPQEPSTPIQSDDWGGFGESAFGADTTNPYLAPAAPQYLPAAPMPASPSYGGKIVNVPTDIGSILNYAVEVWKENLGLLVGAYIVVLVIGGAVQLGSDRVAAILVRGGQGELAFAVDMVAIVARFVVDMFLYAGYWQMMLRMARRRRVEFNDLFGAGPVWLPAMGVAFLLTLATGLGFVLLIIPGILVMLFFWPSLYLVIDAKASVMESFGVAREITANNIGTSFLVGLLAMGIAGLGFLACCVGVIVAMPLASLLWAVAYLMMSGQIPLDPRQPAAK